MKNKRWYPWVLVGAALLASCVDTAELYPGNAFANAEMVDNRYARWDDGIVEPQTSVTLSHGKNGYWNGSGEFDSPSSCYGLKDAKNQHPEYFRHGDKELTWTEQGDGPYGADIVGGGIAEWADNTPLVGTVYGQTKKLAHAHPSFRKGYLSKLYNGQVKCDGWSNYSMVLIDKEGYGTRFPRTLQQASYFGFVARGASDSTDSGKGRVITVDITVSFYKRASDGVTLSGKAFRLDDVKLQANFSSEFTSFIGFSFEDIGYDPTGIAAMSIRYDLVDDPLGGTDDFSREGGIHTGLGLLEVMFPDSIWN